MASIINATTTGITVTGDNSGQLTLSANGSTALTANTAGHCTFTNNFASVAGYPAYQCRAWVNFNGTGTVAIRASGNVTSITDDATGRYTVNFTTAMPDANYAAVVYMNGQSGSTGGSFDADGLWGVNTRAVGSVKVEFYSMTSSTYVDGALNDVAIFR